jgi:hypothetical protein
LTSEGSVLRSWPSIVQIPVWMALAVLSIRLLVPQCSLEAEERNDGDPLGRTCVR